MHSHIHDSTTVLLAQITGPESPQLIDQKLNTGIRHKLTEEALHFTNTLQDVFFRNHIMHGWRTHYKICCKHSISVSGETIIEIFDLSRQY